MKHKGKEIFFDRQDLIVSKTDLKGRITYANDTFLRVAGYLEEEVIGRPHNIIRNPHMPRVVFQLLWEVILSGNEIFAYVVNSTKSGNHYWVLAHVTPTFINGEVVGFHSTRRVPNPKIVKNIIAPIYERLKEIEVNAVSPKVGIEKAREVFSRLLLEKDLSYDAFISELMQQRWD